MNELKYLERIKNDYDAGATNVVLDTVYGGNAFVDAVLQDNKISKIPIMSNFGWSSNYYDDDGNFTGIPQS